MRTIDMAPPVRVQRRLVVVFFAAVLGIGLVVYRDYGLSWDEDCTRVDNGLANYRYLVHGDRCALCHSPEKYHGPAFELLLIFLEKGLGLQDTRPIFFMRHLVTFLLFFTAVLVFYRLLRRRFDSRLVGLAGAAFLVCSPRIFADAFYNPKDLPFLCCYVFSLATLVAWRRQPGAARAALHALSCAVLIDIRILGLLVPLLTLLLAAVDGWHARRAGTPARLRPGPLLLYGLLLVGLTVLFWPLLWHHPLLRLARAFRQMRRYPWGGSVLYFGRSLPATNLPWHYLPVWFGLTTPPLYLLLFGAGLAVLGRRLLRGPSRFLAEHPEDLVFLLAFLLPPLAVVTLRSVVYDGWRHLYFTYPAFLFVAALGLAALWRRARALAVRFRPAPWLFLAALAVPLTATALAMVRTHPYQNVYFNDLAGPVQAAGGPRFELDYWGLSCRRGLEYLAERTAGEVRVYPCTDAVRFSAQILPPELRHRLCFTRRPEDADYCLCHPRGGLSTPPPPGADVFDVSVEGARILFVRKLH
jgi:hypothetical protein